MSQSFQRFIRPRRIRQVYKYPRQPITFDMLPDDVLLEIFDFHVDHEESGIFTKKRVERWITLAHVCRRWRHVVFQSPHRLNIRLVCTRKLVDIDIWPPLPLVIYHNYGTRLSVDNITAALEHNNRVCDIDLQFLTGSEWEYITDSAAMQKPFPELTDLWLSSSEVPGSAPGPIPPDSILGGTPHAPRLRSLHFRSFPFPGVPKLLLSLTRLVDLVLDEIPPSGYFPPEVMATSLSALTSLEFLSLQFQQPPPRPALESRPPLPPRLTRSILPTLTRIDFKGASEYLEVILARIDPTQLNALDITFFNQIIFDTPQLFQLISRTPTLRARKKCIIDFVSKKIEVRFPLQTSHFGMKIRCIAPEWQLSSLEQVCTSCVPPVSTLEDLYISVYMDRSDLRLWQNDVEHTLWLDLLRPFVAVKNLYLTEPCALLIACALQELVGGRTTEVLPTLEKISLTPRIFPEGIKTFVAARQLINRPVTLS